MNAANRTEQGKPTKTWEELAGVYQAQIDPAATAPVTDSAFLREHGVAPTVLSWVGDVGDKVVLDAGCGPGWLHQTITAGAAYACDVAEPETVPDHVTFTRQDLCNLDYESDMFDVVVSSLVLIWVNDIDAALREMYRVTKPGGSLVVSLVHPSFYRRCTVNAAGQTVIERSLADTSTAPVSIGGAVGPFEYFFRSPNDYINTMIAAGWQLDELADWFVDRAAYDAAGVTGLVTRPDDVPMYMFIRATKRT